MSEGSGALVWQCVHCQKVVPGVSPGFFPYCPFCSRPQQSPQRPLCVNPNCREQLFTPTAEFCHKCNANQRQQQSTTPGPQTSRQPPSTTPELQRPTEGHGNRTTTGGSFQGGSGDTNNEEFFDAQSVLPQHQTAGHPPPSFRYRGPPPSSQSQGFRYPQVFGVQSQHGGHRGPSPGAVVFPHVPHGQLPYYPQPQLPPDSQWVWSPSSQPQGYGHPQGGGVQQQRFSPQMRPTTAEMVHGQILSSPRRPPPLPSPSPPPPAQPPPPQPTSLPGQPSRSGVATPQIHPGQSHTQLRPSLQPQPSQSSQPGQPLASGISSPQQPPGDGKPQEILKERVHDPQDPPTQVLPSFQPQPSKSSPPSQPGQPLASGTSSPQQPPGDGNGKPLKEPIHAPQEPPTQVSPSFQSQRSQSFPPSQPDQPLASGTSSPQHPPGGSKVHSQPPGPEVSKEPTHSPQQPTSDNTPPQKQETDGRMQVSTTQPPPEGSSASETKTPLSPEPPVSHPSDIHPSSAATSSSTDKLQTVGHDHSSTDPHSQHEQQKMPSEDRNKDVKDSDVANGTREQSSILAQGTTTPPETTTTAEPPPDLPGLPEHPLSSEDDGKSEGNKGGQKRTAESDEEIPPAKLPRQEGNKEDSKKEPIVKTADSELEPTPPSPKQPKDVPTKSDPTTNPTEPDNQPSQRMGDPLTGSTTVTKVSLYCWSNS